MVRPAKKTRYVHYYTDGSLYGKGFMLGEKMDGYWEWFRKDGSMMRSGHFANGKQVGEWVTYDKKGKLTKVTEMK